MDYSAAIINFTSQALISSKLLDSGEVTEKETTVMKGKGRRKPLLATYEPGKLDPDSLMGPAG